MMILRPQLNWGVRPLHRFMPRKLSTEHVLEPIPVIESPLSSWRGMTSSQLAPTSLELREIVRYPLEPGPIVGRCREDRQCDEVLVDIHTDVDD